MYYTLRTTTAGDYELVKFDKNFEFVTCYAIKKDKSFCDCPSYKQPCKHIKMFLPRFKEEKQINSYTHFYNAKTNTFVKETD